MTTKTTLHDPAKIATHRQLAAAEVALRMKANGLPEDFVAAVLDRAMHQEGFLDLVELWDEAATDERERAAIVANLYEHLSDQGLALKVFTTAAHQDKLADLCDEVHK